MPVPPQEYTPSLSPRQSFGANLPCLGLQQQTRSGNLRALWQLQGSFQELSPSSTNSLTWRESLTGLTTCPFQQQSPPSPGERLHTGSTYTYTTSHTQSSTAGHHNPTGTQTRTPQGSNKQVQHITSQQEWDTSVFSIQLLDRLTVMVSQGRVTNNQTQGSTHRLDGSEQRGGGCIGFPRNKHRHKPPSVSELHEGILQRSDGTHVQTIDGRLEEEPPSRLNSTVLTACTWVDTCHP
jgi:hypothetical protein